jgi:hypothetical protein
MLAVTPLLDQDLGLGAPGVPARAYVSSQTVTVWQRRTVRYPPICMISMPDSMTLKVAYNERSGA